MQGRRTGHGAWPSSLLLGLPNNRVCSLTCGYANVAAQKSKSIDVTAKRELLEQIGQKLGIKELSDWYSISRLQVIQRGGKALFKNNRSGTLASLLKELYPDHSWQANAFVLARPPTLQSWGKVQIQKRFLEAIAPHLEISKMEDWYKVSRKQVIDLGGGALFYHHSSMFDLLSAVYPETKWEPTKFGEKRRKAAGYWESKGNLLRELQHAEKHLGIKQPEDWYSVTLADLQALGFTRKISKTQLAELLQKQYPNYKWDKLYIMKGRFAQQRRLEGAVNSLFSGVEILRNVRKETDLVNPETGQYLELDIFIPSLKLAFEFQEQHHFVTTKSSHKPIEQIQERDRLKVELAKSKGLTLIPVPYWWDGRLESLVATIKKARPDLLKDYPLASSEEGIPEEVPADASQSREMASVEGIGVPLTASFFTTSNVDPSNWWVFEKYDGIRGFWNPEKKAFYSRHGKQIPFPEHILETMPKDTFLDGEIWFGRENFQEAMKLVHRIDSSQVDWEKFKYMVYDIPTLTDKNYQDRYNQLEDYMAKKEFKFIELAPKQVCEGESHLETIFQDIIDKGGEGIILRDPKAPFKHGRTASYLKHKKFRDAEARIISKTGPHSWTCELPNGTQFVASPGTTLFNKRWNPQPGDIVSFKHHGYLLGSHKPKFPTLYRLRNDISWNNVVENWKEQKTTPSVPPLRKKRVRPAGFWRKIENRRQFFINMAEEMGFDPFKPENWDKIRIPHLVRRKGSTLASLYGGSVKKALADSFPELSFTVRERPAKKKKEENSAV